VIAWMTEYPGLGESLLHRCNDRSHNLAGLPVSSLPQAHAGRAHQAQPLPATGVVAGGRWPVAGGRWGELGAFSLDAHGDGAEQADVLVVRG
jgi:hypothetical protein